MKKTYRNNYKSGVAFLDMIMNIMMRFGFMFIIAITLITVAQKTTNNPENKSLVLIQLDWDDNADDDLDLWAKAPNGDVLSFRSNKAGVGFMTLDRDDRGNVGDSVFLPDGNNLKDQLNREVITLRQIIPGEYIFNVHLFSHRSTLKSITVKVTFITLDPYKIQTIVTRNYTITGQEETFLRVIFDENKKIVSIKDGPTDKIAIQGSIAQ